MVEGLSFISQILSMNCNISATCLRVSTPLASSLQRDENIDIVLARGMKKEQRNNLDEYYIYAYTHVVKRMRLISSQEEPVWTRSTVLDTIVDQ